MLIGPFPYELSRVWYSLNHFTWIFLLALGLVAAYMVYFGAVVTMRLRSLRKVQNNNSVRESLAQLNYRSANLRQVILAMFYCFGFTFFFQLQNAFYTPDNNRPVGPMVLTNFSICFGFAAFIFLFFLVLHLVQWFISGRIGRAALRLDAKVTG
jgi:hypothetical protein